MLNVRHVEDVCSLLVGSHGPLQVVDVSFDSRSIQSYDTSCS